MKFYIRDLLWLTVVVALVVGWYSHYRQFSEQLRKARRDNQELYYRLNSMPSPYD